MEVVQQPEVNPHQRCGYNFRHCEEGYFFILQSPEMSFRVVVVGRDTQKEAVPKKTHFFVISIENCFEDAKQDENTRPGSAGIDNEASWSC